MLVVFIGVGILVKQSPNSSKIVDEIQNKILQKDSETISTLEKISSVLLLNSDSIFHQFVHIENIYDLDGLIFLIYEHDTLIFWSSNLAPITPTLNNSPNGLVFTENAWYRKLSYIKGSYNIVGLYLIKTAFVYQNEYLINSFHKSFRLKNDVNISTNKSSYNILSAKGDFLFSLEFPKDFRLTSNQTYLLLFLFLISMSFIVRLIYEIHFWYFCKKRNLFLLILGFLTNIFLFRLTIFYYKIPAILYTSDLFSPKYYAYSDFLPSIGDFFINSVLLFLISILLLKSIKYNLKYQNAGIFIKTAIVFILLSVVILLFNFLILTIESLIIDSNVSTDLNNIFSINQISIFVFLTFASLIFSFFILTSKFCYFAYRLSSNLLHYTITLLLTIILIKLLFINTFQNYGLFFITLNIVYVISLFVFFRFKNTKITILYLVFYLLFFSFLSTYSLHFYNVNKEHETRKLLAVNLATAQKDYLAEFLLKDLTKLILTDTSVYKNLNHYYSILYNEILLKKYIEERYFSGYFKKYNLLLTICDETDSLYIQPEKNYTSCTEFFENIINYSGKVTENKNLHYINYGQGDNGYLLDFHFDSLEAYPENPITIYVELTPKFVSKEFGFPDLLMDRHISKNPDLTNYSYAKYQDGALIRRVGQYNYNLNLTSQGIQINCFKFINDNDFDHLYYKSDTKQDLIISIKQKSFMDLLSPFSYIFLFYSLLLILILLLFVYPDSLHKINFNFRTRLQFLIAFILVFSFLVIGYFSVNYIHNLNAQKNNDILNEKTHSVLVELQQKISNEESLDPNISPLIGDLLVKFSTVFFSDINIFDLNGNLFSTSRPQIYDENLISRKMNSTAFRELNYNKRSFFIQTEHIGKQKYLSAYIPFVNTNNTIIAYLNLPYFAKQNDLEKEISTFLVTYINLYVILIALSILVALFISNYVSLPIKLIMNKISQVKLGGKNEKIIWSRKDEIGQLVFEYNRMIDELALSAELLAKSERESAWREMAKQVAHEIKNPLTPMKLSVQYLQKTYFDNVPDWDMRLEKFTQTMIEQIETLSVVATGFSDFAKMPESDKQNVDIKVILHNSIGLFKNYENIQFNLKLDENTQYLVLADKEQLLRAFNNLFKNAVQAIGEESIGKIDIILQKHEKTCIIEISDTGKGIPKEYNDKIFFPNFTTKSGGMGLGLAIVKNIIVSSGGEISFYSKKEKGTTFKIMLPLII